MNYYQKEDILQLQNNDGNYYVPKVLFESRAYKLVRLEVKWGYVALLNALIQHPSFDEQGQAFIEDDLTLSIDILKVLANKNVDEEKMKGYQDELEAQDLLVSQGHQIYLKKL